MKKSITILTLLAGATGLYAQGTIELSDYLPSFSASIWSPQNNPTQELQGNTQYDLPAGSVGIGGNSTTYQGVPIGGGSTGTGPTAYGNGNLFTVGIYAAPGVGNTAGLTAAETTGQPIAVSTFLTSGGTGVANVGTASGNDSSGMYALNYGSPQTTALPGYTGGATFQLLAWYNGGVASTVVNADAQYAASLEYGQSTIESIASLGGNGAPAATPGTFGNTANGERTGLITSFTLTEVPEPSTIALGVIGASSFLFRRRK